MNINSGITQGAGGSLRTYAIGFGLALVLTLIPFWLVMTGIPLGNGAVISLAVFAAIQIVVHLVFFLHLNGSAAQSWPLMAFLFAVLILVTLIGGSIWIMNHLNHNMMPMMMGG